MKKSSIPATILLLILKTVTTFAEPTVVIGGLFPIHGGGDRPDRPCGSMLLEKGFQRAEAMLYAIDLINANSSYWNFRMEAKILDTCVSESHALEQSRKLLMDSCGGEGDSRKVNAVVGASNSEVSIAVANIFNLFQIPQVSYASTSLKLDDVDKYSNFFRVVPSDRFQVEAIIDILLRFRWSYVSMIISKGEYGESAAQYLRERIANRTRDRICIATVEMLPKSPRNDDFDAAIRRLDNHDKAKVVIVFLNEERIKPLFDACLRCMIALDRFVWIGSDGWGVKKSVVEFHSKYAEGAITIHPRTFSVPGFDNYFLSLKASDDTQNPWFKEFWKTNKNVNWKKDYQQGSYVPMVIDSVFLLASAIRDFCLKYGTLCDNPKNWDEKYKELINFIKNTTIESIQGNNINISFDENRSVPVNYTIYQYRLLKNDRPSFYDQYEYIPIGEWNLDKRLTIRENPKWFTEERKQIPNLPVSSCNDTCADGHERVSNPEFPGISCCWSCRECPLLSYLPKPDLPCKKCPHGQYPTDDKKSCFDLPFVYLGKNLRSPWALVPLFFAVFGIISTCAVFAIFLFYHKTPIIMASGRELCHVILVGIILCYCFAFIVLLEPTKTTCGALRVTMGLGLSMCYSAIFTKTNRISRIFNVSGLKRPSYISPESQIVICACLIVIQLTLTVLWLIVKPSGVDVDYLGEKEWVVFCTIDDTSVLLGLLFNMLLLVLCTVYAYKTRNIPENFNETKWISFTMYSCCIVWLAFVPIYYNPLVDYRVKATILSMSVMLSGTVTLVCIFLPKIYIVLFHPERNVRFPSSSANISGSGTETFDSDQPVHYLRTGDMEPRQPSPRPDSPFIFRRTENGVLTTDVK